MAGQGEGSFSNWVPAANKETEAEINTAQALFGGQRMEARELSSQINFSPICERDLILKSKDKGRRSEANDGEAWALVYWGRGRALLRDWGAIPFLSVFWSLLSSQGHWWVCHLI